jgi:hypothetical protein
MQKDCFYHTIQDDFWADSTVFIPQAN